MARLVVFARHARSPGSHQALVNQVIPASSGARQGDKKTERGRSEKVKVKGACGDCQISGELC